MNAIALFVMLVLQGNPTCHAQPPQQVSVEGQTFQVSEYDCYWRESAQQPSRQFEVWSPVCPRYVGAPILVSERNLRKGWAMNEFGEFYPATSNVYMMHVYRPRCEG
ncbi:MAG: hypothetical protein C4293_06960 [Nitrospiraceae bacterium]